MTEQAPAQSTASSSLDGSNTPKENKESADVEIAKEEETAPPPSPRNIHGFRWILAVVAVVSSILLYATDNTIVGYPWKSSERSQLPMLTNAGCDYPTFNH